jgi:hypothetical protein
MNYYSYTKQKINSEVIFIKAVLEVKFIQI